jgi:hypothetical protein
MSRLMRIRVVSQRGRLVGIWVPPVSPPTDPKGPAASLVAGPGQKIHDIEIEVGTLARQKEIDAFHAVVRKKLRLRK